MPVIVVFSLRSRVAATDISSLLQQ